MAYRWSKKVSRYYSADTGRWVPKEVVLKFVDLSVNASADTSLTLMRHYQDSTLSAIDWQQLMKQELKKEHIRQYALGRGGLEQMSQKDWGKIGSMLKEQYQYLSRFADDLESGKSIGGAALSRAQMYPRAAREAYERGHQAAQMASDEPPDEELWGLGMAEHCENCVAFNSMGWQPIKDDPYDGAFPGSGDTACLSNCKCTIEYRRGVVNNV